MITLVVEIYLVGLIFLMLSSIALFFILLPYLSPMPLGSDIQPLAGFFSMVWLAANSNRVKLDHFDLWLLIFALLYTLNFDRTGGELSSQVLRKHINMLYVYPIYLFAKNIRYIKMDVFQIVLFLTLTVAVLQSVSPGLHGATIGQILRFKDVEFGASGRGLSILAPEPTDMGFTAFYYFVLVSILSLKSAGYKKYTLLKVVSVFLALLTLSGSSIFAFFFALFASLNFTWRKALYSIMTICVVVIALQLAMTNIPESVPRPFVMLHTFLIDPLALVGSTSLGYRASHFWLGLSSLVVGDFPIIGSGIGSLREQGSELLGRSGILQFVPFTAYYHAGMISSVTGVQLSSSAGQLTLEMGLIGLLALIIIFVRLYHLGVKVDAYIGKLVVIAFALFVFQSFPLSYPPPWFVLGILANRNLRIIPPRMLVKILPSQSKLVYGFR